MLHNLNMNIIPDYHVIEKHVKNSFKKINED